MSPWGLRTAPYRGRAPKRSPFCDVVAGLCPTGRTSVSMASGRYPTPKLGKISCRTGPTLRTCEFYLRAVPEPCTKTAYADLGHASRLGRTQLSTLRKPHDYGGGLAGYVLRREPFPVGLGPHSKGLA
jgi:hypothetical protein